MSCVGRACVVRGAGVCRAWGGCVSCVGRSGFARSGASSATSHLDNCILIIFNRLGDPHSKCTLIFDIMTNLYVYHA